MQHRAHQQHVFVGNEVDDMLRVVILEGMHEVAEAVERHLGTFVASVGVVTSGELQDHIRTEEHIDFTAHAFKIIHDPFIPPILQINHIRATCRDRHARGATKQYQSGKEHTDFTGHASGFILEAAGYFITRSATGLKIFAGQ